VPTSARVIGVYGAGKTTEAMNILDRVLEREVLDPLRIGYSTFTRSARRVAAERAADRVGASVKEIESNGWFRTLHSVAFRCLKTARDELLAGGKKDNAWLSDAVQENLSLVTEGDDGDALWGNTTTPNAAERALALWNLARSQLRPYRDLVEDDRGKNSPSLSTASAVVARYEDAKSRDGRLDFTDLLLQFAGIRATPEGYEKAEPRGECPLLPVWFLDEAQDCTALSMACFRRLTACSQWVYLFGDSAQAVFQWAGADPRYFEEWPVVKERKLLKTHRCSARIVAMAERMLRLDEPRGVEPAREGGDVDMLDDPDWAARRIADGETVLVLARTNRGACTLSHLLDRHRVPWRPIKGRGGCDSPKKLDAAVALRKLQEGGEVTGHEWASALEVLPSRPDGQVLLAHGIKKHFEDKANQDSIAPIGLKLLECVGATEALKRLIASGGWQGMVPGLTHFSALLAKHGEERVRNPLVRVGTAHAAKGLEADHVLLSAQMSAPGEQDAGAGKTTTEERRVWHVACSRAKDRLTVLTTVGGRGDYEGFHP
jgi:DNA helicase-2/ATP-dependent DNA helicase PcrA